MLALCKGLAKWGVGTMRMDPKKKNTFAIDITIETCEKRLELMLGSFLPL